MFLEKDLSQIAQHGLTIEAVEQQIENFRTGFPFLKVTKSASPEDGVKVLDEKQIAKYAADFDKCSASLEIVKFVPASGAATRMFKELFEYVSSEVTTAGIDKLLENIGKFAFYNELHAIIGDNATPVETVSAIIGKGLQYGSRPKGLVSFHSYPDGERKAIEEHLVEGAQYTANNGEVHLHFTASSEHIDLFRALLDQKLPYYEERFGVKYHIDFSVQKPSTDTIAVDMENNPFRTNQGALLFRPAGHGALIENLNTIDADVIFIKNIDNVTTDALRDTTVLYKKALAALLVELQDRAFEYLKSLEVGGAELEPIANFIEQELYVKLPKDYTTQLLKEVLDRPMRICGVVRNEGEPGGGPFWVRDSRNIETLQIAESTQISPDDKHLMASATHFNPVDLVCAVRNSKGEKFDLTKYVDPTTGFISSKSSEGRELKAQELPGLWNGAMANWNTIFVEVPIETFSPVKVVQDLLRPQHQ